MMLSVSDHNFLRARIQLLGAMFCLLVDSEAECWLTAPIFCTISRPSTRYACEETTRENSRRLYDRFSSPTIPRNMFASTTAKQHLTALTLLRTWHGYSGLTDP
ncbi:hypothetical protein C8F04DRAFT_1128743, partial [Mycena alexandri]